MRLFIVRHGEVEDNVNRRIIGSSDSPLTEKGYWQIDRIADRLKHENINVAYSSELGRAIRTAKGIMKHHKATKLCYDPRINEKNDGIYEGRKYGCMREAAEKAGISFIHFKPEGGETVIELKKKMIGFYAEMNKRHSNKNVLIVAHGGPITNLFLYLFKDNDENFRIYHAENTALSILNIENGDISVELLNSTKHLI
jgi:probable phosphoglycerate mutase